MSASVVGDIKVKNSDKWVEYRRKVPETLAPWGEEVLFRGRQLQVLSGEHSYIDVVVIRSPDSSSVVEWYNSKAYQALIPVREQAADMVLVSYE